MWLALNDCFLSIVKKDCPEDSLLVRARRPGDIEKVFGRRTKVTRATDADYLYRAVIAKDDVVRAMQDEVLRISYGNFKDSVADDDLHDAYMKVWSAMAALQSPGPYSDRWVPSRPLTNEAINAMLPLNKVSVHDLAAQVAQLGADSLLPPTKGGLKKAAEAVESYHANGKKNSKQQRKAARLIRKHGASIGTEPRSKE